MDPTSESSPAGPRLGLRANAAQYTVLIVVSMFVGGMVGLERSVLPILADRGFGLASRTATLSFIVGFGLARAFANLLAGAACDRVGRKTPRHRVDRFRAGS